MRTLQVGNRPTQLALALAEFGRIEKTIQCLNYIDDENSRRAILLQLNSGEGRHSLARDIFHGKRGELPQRYREGQEDQLSALGLVVNIIVLWNTIYLDAALAQLRKEGYPVLDEEVVRLSPFIHERHINLLGRLLLRGARSRHPRGTQATTNRNRRLLTWFYVPLLPKPRYQAFEWDFSSETLASESWKFKKSVIIAGSKPSSSP